MVDEKMSNVWDDFKQNHMEDVKMFMEKNKTRPSTGAKDKNENKMYDGCVTITYNETGFSSKNHEGYFYVFFTIV